MKSWGIQMIPPTGISLSLSVWFSYLQKCALIYVFFNTLLMCCKYIKENAPDQSIYCHKKNLSTLIFRSSSSLKICISIFCLSFIRSGSLGHTKKFLYELILYFTGSCLNWYGVITSDLYPLNMEIVFFIQVT